MAGQRDDKTTPLMRVDWGVWRPVLTLGITQIIGFGTIYYAFGVMVGPLSADLGITPTWAFGALSAALLAGGLAAPAGGRLVDARGARKAMAAGSAAIALGFALMTLIGNGWTLLAALAFIEIAAVLVLYDAAFAALAQAVGTNRARRAITLMTLMGGFASTVFWPLTLALTEVWGWRGTLAIFAAMHLFICLPLHLSLPRAQGDSAGNTSTAPAFAPLPKALQGRAMALVAISFALSGGILAAVGAQWVPLMAALGVSQTAAVAAGALMGPTQVAARVLDLTFMHNRHPMVTGLVSMMFLVLAMLVLALAPPSVLTISVFAMLFGAGQGLSSMARGMVPLALFGALGYAARLGQLARLRSLMTAASPFAMAAALAGLGTGTTLGLAVALALASAVALALVPWRVTA